MEQTAQIKECAHTVAGIVAHVDAGKTTLAESMLYLTGGTRKLGRVDHKDAFLDTYELEKKQRNYDFFQAGRAKFEKQKAYAFRYARPCGFFGRDGTNTSGA